MTHSALSFSFVSALAFAGCFSGTPEPDPCVETRRCVAADAVGCCSGGGREVSVCEDSCPSGMIEETACRMAGCGMGCDNPVSCRVDYGSACCGEAVFTTSCEMCPAGSIEGSSCAADYPGECGCDGIRAFRVPPDDEAAPFFADCFEDLGGGCCGAFVSVTDCGVCPSGTVEQYMCEMMSGGRAAPPATTCREDLGGGCCGSEVAPNACSAECPAGSVDASACDEISADAAPAFPPEPASCFEVTSDGCCGEPVAVTACGGCPTGASTTCDACDP